MRIERAFGDVAVDMARDGILISLPQYPTLALLDIAVASMAHRGDAERWRRFCTFVPAPIFSKVELATGCRDTAGIDGIKQGLFLQVGIGIVDIGDFPLRDTPLDKLLADLVIDVELVRVWRGEVAEDQLGCALVLARLAMSASGSALWRGWSFVVSLDIQQNGFNRGAYREQMAFLAVSGHFKHIHLRIDAAVLQFLRPFHQACPHLVPSALAMPVPR